MTSYPPPLSYLPIFNSDEFNYANDPINISTGNSLYIKKSGADTAIGPLTLLNKILLPSGIATAPSLTFSSGSNTGLYLSAASTLAFTTGGVQRLTISTTDLVSTLPIKTNEFRSRSSFGSAGNVIYGATDGTQGMYFGLNQVSLGTNSTERLRVIDTRTIAYTPITTADASATTPSIHFSSSTSTGLYYTAGPTLNVSVNGVQRAAFETGGLKLYGPTAGNNALYVPSGLQYYEESVDINSTFTYGSVSVSNIPIRLTRIGRQVFCQITTDMSFSANAQTPVTVSSAANIIPTRFRPNNVCCFASAWSNRNGTYNSFLAFIELAGTINIWHSNYTPSSSSMYLWAFSGTWTL